MPAQASGKSANATTLQRATRPVAAAASEGRAGCFSIASAHSFAVLPHVCSAMPEHAGEGPSPTAATKSSANTNESMPRRALSSHRAGSTARDSALTLRAARQRRARARSAADVVPMAAMPRLAGAGQHAELVRGGGQALAAHDAIFGSPPTAWQDPTRQLASARRLEDGEGQHHEGKRSRLADSHSTCVRGTTPARAGAARRPRRHDFFLIRPTRTPASSMAL
jgi:hypothetical protein